MTAVSVVIPAHNAGQWIDRTLASVRAQTSTDIEIIVVDDGSSDDTASRVRKQAAQDDRIRLVTQENSGVAAARNRGIELARSPWVAPLDADDIWHPRTVERFLAAAAAAPEPVAFVYTWSRRIDEDDRLVSDLGRISCSGRILPQLLVQNFIRNASATMLDRAAVLGIGGYDTQFHRLGARGSEDIDLYLRLAAHGQVAVAPGYHVGYRQTGSAMSHDARRMRASLHLAIDKFRKSQPHLPPRLFDAANTNYDLYAAGLSFIAGKWTDLGAFAMAALRRAPLTSLAHLSMAGSYSVLAKLRLRPQRRFADLDPDRSHTLPLHDVLFRLHCRSVRSALCSFHGKPAT